MAAKSEEINGGKDDKRRKICGIPAKAFWVLIAIVVVAVIGGGVAGGVTGSRSRKSQSSPQAEPSSTSSSVSSPEPTATEAFSITTVTNTTNSSAEKAFSADKFYSISQVDEFFLNTTSTLLWRFAVAGFVRDNVSTMFMPHGEAQQFGHFGYDGPAYSDNEGWQFTEIPSTNKRAKTYRQTLNLDPAPKLYWIANQYYGIHNRLSMDDSAEQKLSELRTFDGRTNFTQPCIRQAGNNNLAQWWWFDESYKTGELRPKNAYLSLPFSSEGRSK